MGFIQIIEYRTSRRDELEQLDKEWWEATEGRRSVVREVHCRDRDRPNHYVAIVEFASYEEAMENSELPETRALAERFAALCDEPPTFRNLDVLNTYGN